MALLHPDESRQRRRSTPRLEPLELGQCVRSGPSAQLARVPGARSPHRNVMIGCPFQEADPDVLDALPPVGSLAIALQHAGARASRKAQRACHRSAECRTSTMAKEATMVHRDFLPSRR